MTTIPTSQLKIPNEQRTEIDALSSMYQDDFHRVNDHRWENGVHYWVRVKWDDGESSQSKSAVLPGIAVRVDVKLPRSYPQKSPPEIQFQPLTGYEAVLEEKDIKNLGSKTQGMMHDYAADYSEAIYNVLQEAQLILEKRLEAVRNSVTVHEEMEMRQKEERERQQRLMDKMRKEHERDQEEKNLALMKQIEKERRKQSRKQLQKKRRQELAQKDARMGVIMGSDKEPFGVGLPESEKAASGERKRGTACAAGDENDDYEFGSAEDDDDDDEEDDWGGVEDWHDKKKRDDHELRQNALFQDLIMTSDGSEERKDKENNDKKSQSSRFIHEYTITGILGKGGFGSVVRAKYNLDEKEYAIKIIPLRSSAYMSARQEITTLASLNHNFIVRYYHSWVESIDPYEKMRALGFGEGCLSDVSSSLERTKEKNVRGGERGGGGGEGKKERVNGDDPPSEGSAAGKGDDADGDNGDEVSSRNVITHGDVIFFANNEAAQFLDNLENDDTAGLAGEADDGDFMQTSEIGKEELSSSGNGANKEWLFIQMEFCPNKTLQDVIKNQEAHNDPKKAWRLFRQLLEAIDHIHKKGIIHRDLKPANIFIDSKENVKLGDFGLAFGGEGQNNADTEGSELVEQPSDVVGTFLYRSPEQAEKGKKYDSKADMYALGIILYELFRPFHTGQERANAIIQLRKGGCIGEGDWALGDKQQQQQQQLQHASDKRSNKASNAAKVENKSSTVTIIEELLRADPRQRPSAQMLLEDKRIPIELGEQLLEKALVKLSTKGDSFNHRVLDKLFSIEPSPAIDFIYDRMESQQRYSQAATRVSMNAFSNTVNAFSHANAVKDRVLQFVEGVFRAHGSNRMSPPLLRPKKRGTWDFDKNAPRFLDKSGRQVVLPFSLTIPYARFLAQRYRREIGAHAAEDFIRRHDSGKVFRNLKAVDTPKEFMQCCYDSAWVRKEEWRRIEIYESVEIIAMAEEIMESFPELGNGVIYVSHTSILPAIVKAALESTAKQSLTQKDVQSFIKAVHRVCAGQRIGKDRKSVISSDLIKLLKNNSLPESALRVFRAGLHCYAGVGEISSKWKERFCKVILKSRKQSHSGNRGGENIRKKKGRRKKSKHNNVPQQQHHHSHHPQLSWKQLIEERAKAAIEEIRQIMQALKFMNRGSRVVFDPGLALKEPMFKSGLIFQVCTYGEETTTGGLGEVIAIGGRYDELVATFSPPVITSTKEMQKPLEAIGLNLAVEKIIQAVARNDKSSPKSYLKQGGGTAGAASNIGRRLPGLQDTSSLIFSAHGANNMSDMDVRIKLAAKLWASGIRAEYRYPIRIFDLNIARQYCCDIGLRWLVETRAGKDQGLVRIRDASIQDRNAYFEIRREAVPLWILSHSGPSLSKLPGDTKASSGAQPQLASDLTTKKRATSGNVYPNIYFIPNYIQKHASIGEKLLECLAGMHVQVNQDVKLVAVNLRILEIRELMSKVMDGQQAAYICPKKFKGNDPRRLLVKYACGIRTKSIRALFIYSILDGKVDVVQL